MKKILGFLILLSSVSSAYADGTRCIIGGRYQQSDVEAAMATQNGVEKVTITKSKWAAIAMNPISWVIDWNLDYRTMSFIFADKGQTQKLTNCKANFDRSQKVLNIYACGGDVLLRLGKFSHYAVETFNIDLSALKGDCSQNAAEYDDPISKGIVP